MAYGTIEIKFNLRPCIVGQQRALFHCWEQRSEVIPPSPMVGGHSGGAVSQILGIIEREDGTIHKAYPEEIIFIDGAAKREHKVSELEEQNSELKRLLKLAVEGFDFIDDNFGCAGCHGGWEKCPYNNQGEVDYCTDQWKYRAEAMKLIGDDE